MKFVNLFLHSTAAITLCSRAFSAEAVLELERIEVTAQKRPQAPNTVPLAVNAYSGAFLSAANIDSYQDLAPLVPGFFAQEQSANNPAFNLRGITSDSLDPRAEPRMSVFQDGVSISRAQASVVEPFDLERIEVLKGPQGTLFGRSAEIGALSLIQNQPRNATERSFAAGFGNFNERRAHGIVNSPLVAGRLLGRFAFAYVERDGFIPNLADGSTLNGKQTLALRGSLRWQPDAATTADLILNYQHDTPPGTAFKSGIIAPTGGDTSPFTPAELNRGHTLGLDRTVIGATAIVTRQLGAIWTLTSTTAWRDYDAFERFDADGSRLYLIELADDSAGRQFSQEARLNFESGHRSSGFVGASYFHESGREGFPLSTDERQLWPFLSGQFRDGLVAAGVPAALANAAIPTVNPFTAVPALPASFQLFNNPALPASLRGLATLAGKPLKPSHNEAFINSGRTDATDVFLDGTWWPADRFELTAGARVTFEHIASGYEVTDSPVPGTLGFILGAAPNDAFRPTNGRREAGASHTGLVARLAGRYEISPQVSAYASVARGRRPAALVLDATVVTPLHEEIVWNHEIGLKGSAAGGRLTWSTAAFLYRYRNFQSVTSDPRTPGRFITVDAGNATGRGFEFSAQGAAGAHATFFGTYGYTDATFDATGDNGQPQRYAGNTLRLTARHTLALGATFSAPLGGGKFSLTPVYQYKSRHWFDDDNTRFAGSLRQDGFALVNLRATWRSPKDQWEISVHAQNLFDRDYLIDAGNVGATYGIPTFVAGPPRFCGAEVTRHW